MLIITDLAIALIFTLLIGLFFLGCRRCGPWQGLGWFFMLLFLFTWAGGVWTGPYGPVLWGYYWLPFFIVGIVFALLLAAAVVPGPRATGRKRSSRRRPRPRRNRYTWR